MLSDCEEALLCGLLTGVHQKQVVLTQKYVQRVAALVFPNKRAAFGINWARGFLKQNDEFFLKHKKRAMAEGRITATTFDQAVQFSNVYGNLLSSYESRGIPLTPECLLNMDETLIQYMEKGGLDIELVPRKERTGSSKPNSSVIGSTIAFVSASGEVPLLYFCMKKGDSQCEYPVPNILIHGKHM